MEDWTCLGKEIMKTFRMIGMAIVAMVLCFGMSSCSNDDEEENPYKDYPQLIVGKWFNFTPEASMFAVYNADGTYSQVGYDSETLGWIDFEGTYSIEDNKLHRNAILDDGTIENVTFATEITKDELVFNTNSLVPNFPRRVHYRVKDQFDIKGNYSYLNSVARVVPAEGKTALQLPEGFLFNGENTIPVESLNGERIIDASKAFFADAHSQRTAS